MGANARTSTDESSGSEPAEPTAEDGIAGASDVEEASYPSPGGEGAGDPMECPEHGTVHPDERPWLPKLDDGDLAPHHYCPDCGTVEGRGRQDGLDRGGLANMIARLEELLDREGYVFTEVQKRIIFKRIEEQDLDDGYGFTRERQLEQLGEIVGDVIGLPKNVVDSYLRRT